MGVQEFNITGTIAVLLNPYTDRITTIFDGAAKSNPAKIPPSTIVSVNSFVKNLRCMASIKSLMPVALPDFNLADSSTEKLKKTLNLEWNSPRKQLDLLIQNRESGWLKVFAVSLLNPMGYPFRSYSLMEAYGGGLAVELGADGAIGVRAADVGFELITEIDDVVIFGSWVQEIVVLTEERPIIINVSGGSTIKVPEPTTRANWMGLTEAQWRDITEVEWKAL